MQVRILADKQFESDFQRWTDSFGVIFPVEINGELGKVKAHDSIFGSALIQPNQYNTREAVLAFQSTLVALVREELLDKKWPCDITLGSEI